MRAKRSHFVGGFGFGRGFWRGTRVVGAGRVRRRVVGVFAEEEVEDGVMGQVVRSWFRRDWAPSRAVVFRVVFCSDRGVLDIWGRGFGSLAMRLPRSKV